MSAIENCVRPSAFPAFGQEPGDQPRATQDLHYSCVYCQVGRTFKLQVDRKMYYVPESVFRAVQEIPQELGDFGVLLHGGGAGNRPCSLIFCRH